MRRRHAQRGLRFAVQTYRGKPLHARIMWLLLGAAAALLAVWFTFVFAIYLYLAVAMLVDGAFS